MGCIYLARYDGKATVAGKLTAGLSAPTSPSLLLTIGQATCSRLIGSCAVKVMRVPYRTPVANAYSERWVRTVRLEVLDRLLLFSPRRLEQVLAEHIDHYNHARPHQGIEQRRPCEPDVIQLPVGRVERRGRLGGVIHEYSRAA